MREAQLSQLRAKEVEAGDKVRAANERVVASLDAEREALAQTERERFVAQALSRLSAEATAQQRREVEQLAGALFDEQQTLQARQRLMDEGRSVIDRTRTATEQHAAEIQKLNELLATGAVDRATYARAVEDASRGGRTIDDLFGSLARQAGPRTIGVVLSGALRDGAKGLAEIKQAGGITMVQSPEDAEFASMPESAIAYDGIVDVIAPTAELARAIERYVYGLEQRHDTHRQEPMRDR